MFLTLEVHARGRSCGHKIHYYLFIAASPEFLEVWGLGEGEVKRKKFSL